MRKVVTLQDIKETAAVKYTPLLIRCDTGGIADHVYQSVDEAEGALEALKGMRAIFGPLSGANSKHVKDMVDAAIEDAVAKLDRARSELESAQFDEFRVKGISAMETQEARRLVLVDKPSPPVKTREVQDGRPLEQVGRIDPARIRDETYTDENDPVYLKELAAYEQEMEKTDTRILAYTLSRCVQGFDLTDEEISDELQEEAHPKEPIEEFRLRLDQIARIILDKLDMRYLSTLQDRISELTGVNQARVDFTRGSLNPLNLLVGSRSR